MTKSTAPTYSRRTVAKAGATAAAGLTAGQFAVPNIIKAKQAGEVSFMNWDVVSGTPLETALNAFQEATGITVNVQPTPVDDYETKFRTLLASGSPPDVMRINDNVVRDYAAAGQLLDLTPFIENPEPYIASLFTFPVTPWGTHPAWTIGTNPRAFYYNVDMFDEAGVSHPPENWTSEGWTWDDFLETAQQLTDEDAQRWGALVYNETAAEQTWAVNNGVESGIYSEDGTEFTLASPEGIEAIQWLADLTCKHGVQPPWSMLQQDQAANQLFASGSVGMRFATLGFTNYLRQNVSDFTWDVAPVPAKVEQKQEGSLIIFCVPQDASNPEGAWQLAEFLAGPEAGQIFAEAGYFVPVWEEAGAALQPGDQPPANIGLFAEAARHNTVVSTNAIGQGLARQIYRPQFDLVFACEASAEEVLTAVEQEVEQVLAESISQAETLSEVEATPESGS
jgi:multiple sugar transport system substrate-binding protein